MGSCSILHSGAIELKQVLVTWEKPHKQLILTVKFSFSECFPIFVIPTKNMVYVVPEFHPCDYEHRQTFKVSMLYLRTDEYRG